MSRTKESQNKALVLEAFDTLFNKRDYVAAERYWSPDYIQHSAHIEPGRDGLFNLIKSVPATLKYEPGVIVADGDLVIVHGRFSGHGRPKELDRGGHPPHRRWSSRRTLGRSSGRGFASGIQERSTDVRSQFHRVMPTNSSPIVTSRFAESCDASSLDLFTSANAAPWWGT